MDKPNNRVVILCAVITAVGTIAAALIGKFSFNNEPENPIKVNKTAEAETSTIDHKNKSRPLTIAGRWVDASSELNVMNVARNLSGFSIDGQGYNQVMNLNYRLTGTAKLNNAEITMNFQAFSANQTISYGNCLGAVSDNNNNTPMKMVMTCYDSGRGNFSVVLHKRS